jgi:symplekin
MTLDLLIKFHGSAHISSVNLMACMGSLTLIAKMRPQYMPKVVTSMETLHSKLKLFLTTIYNKKNVSMIL